jgi:hypothetical protein
MLMGFQIPMVGAVAPTFVGDADTVAWIAAVMAAGGSVSPARSTVVDNLIVGLKSDGVWAKLDRLWLLAGANQQSAWTDLVVRDRVTIGAGGPYVRPDKFTYCDAGNYGFTNYNFATAAHYKQNDAHISIWQMSVGADNNATILSGTATGNAHFYVQYGDGNAYARINDSGGGGVPSPIDCRGLSLGMRNNSSTREAYLNTALLGSTSVASEVPNSATLTLYSRLLCALTAGAALTTGEHAALYARLKTYMEAIGVLNKPSADKWEAAVIADGGTVSSTYKGYVSALLDGLAADGLTPHIDRLWLFAAENQKSAAIDIMACAKATPNGAPAFTKDRGFEPVVGVSNIDLNYYFDGPDYGGANEHVGMWNLSNNSTNDAALASWQNITLIPRTATTPNGIAISVADYYGSEEMPPLVPGDYTGFLLGCRGDGIFDNNRRTMYQNGVSLGTMVYPSNPYWPQLNNSYHYTRLAAAITFGGALSAAQTSAYYTRLRSYMKAVGVAGLDSATTAWAAAVATAGGTVSAARKDLVDDLIHGLKTDGIWAKLDRLWVFAAADSQTALIDLVALTTATPVNSPTFTPNRGYNGNASSSYLNSNFNASTSGVQWTLNSAHIAAWDNTSRVNEATVISGCFDGSAVSDLMPWYGGGVVTRINGGGLAGLSNSSSQGFFVGQRESSSVVSGYRNGAFCASFGDASNHVVSLPMFICGRNDSGGFSSAMSDQVCMVSYGAAFTSTEMTKYYNRLRTYMTAVGVS